MMPEEFPRPPFLEPEGLARLLEWPPRHLRLFREAVAKRDAGAWSGDDGTPEAFYKTLSRYLARPAGLASFEALLDRFDKRRRGLVTKVLEQANIAAASTREGTTLKKLDQIDIAEFVSSLCTAECWDEAAWVAWARLACVTEPEVVAHDPVASLCEIIDQHPAL